MKRVFAGLAVLWMAGCTSPAPDPWLGAPEPRIVATFAPLHCFALNLASEPAQVRGLLGAQGPHHADPPLSQAAMLARANVLFANGLGIDDSIVRKMNGAAGRGGPPTYRLAADLPPALLLEGNACACCKHEHHAGSKQFDGHVWLGIDQAVAICEAMRDKLKLIDPAGTAGYETRTAHYVSKLRALQAEGREMLKNKTERTVLPFHGSLTYFAKTFDLKLMEPIQDVAGQEPSAQRLSELADLCRKENVRIIAVEPQYGSEGSTRTLLAALRQRGITDAVVITLDPLETASEKEFNAEWYVVRMRQNLEMLAKTLK